MDFILIMENFWTIFSIFFLVTIFTWKVIRPGPEKPHPDELETTTTADIDVYPAQY